MPENTAKQMRKRNSVSSEYWHAWVRGAEARGRKDVTYGRLAKIAAAKRLAAPTEGAAA